MKPHKKKPIAAAPAGAEFLTPAGVVARYSGAVTIETLRNWRYLKRGPPYTHIERKVVYPITGLIEWEKSHTLQGERI